MSTNSINPFSGNLQSLLSTALNGTGLSLNSTASTSSSATSSTNSSDNSQLSPLAQLMNTLQQLQQSNPTQYKQVTQEIGANLQKAAQTAQSQGNTAEAKQLTQLASDFNNASKSGQLPSTQDLAKAAGGHHHHHHSQGASSETNSASSTSTTSGSNSSSSTASNSSQLNQLLSSIQSSGTQSQSDSLNPIGIILNTLSSAGIGTSGS